MNILQLSQGPWTFQLKRSAENVYMDNPKPPRISHFPAKVDKTGDNLEFSLASYSYTSESSRAKLSHKFGESESHETFLSYPLRYKKTIFRLQRVQTTDRNKKM